MMTYDLYLESGPKRRRTMVHVLDLLGCVATGPTTDEAVAATPDAIRAYKRFLRRHGEAMDPDEPFATRVVEHIMEGNWLGNGSPYLIFGPDFAPVTDAEIEVYLNRLRWVCGELAEWTEIQSEGQLNAQDAEGGRPAQVMLLHVIGAQGTYPASALNGAPGFSRVRSAAERGEIGLPEALRRIAALAEERVRAATAEERAAVRELPSGKYTLRKALRRMLEHDWEHLVELSRRPGGPTL